MKFVTVLVLLTLGLIWTLPAQASVCRNNNHHQICILSIKRSAKNYWEYRAAIRVDGIERPNEIYNCRDRTRTRQDGTVIQFQEDGPGDLICRLLNR